MKYSFKKKKCLKRPYFWTKIRRETERRLTGGRPGTGDRAEGPPVGGKGDPWGPVSPLPPYYSATSLLGIYPREMRTYVHTKVCSWMFTAALFVKAKN